MALQNDLIEKTSGELMTEKSKRLDDEEQRFKRGFQEQVAALAAINDGGLYSVYGFASIVEYAEVRLDVAKARTYQLLECASVFKALGEKSTIGGQITHERLLRPLAGMKTESKVRVLQAAVREAQGGALTGQFIEDLARERFNWKTRKEFREEKKPASVKQQEAFEANAAKSQRLFGQLLDLGNPSELVEKYGSARNWGPLWQQIADWFDELKELS